MERSQNHLFHKVVPYHEIQQTTFPKEDIDALYECLFSNTNILPNPTNNHVNPTLHIPLFL